MFVKRVTQGGDFSGAEFNHFVLPMIYETMCVKVLNMLVSPHAINMLVNRGRK